ncbi:TraB/GumN family protein [Novosphingobium sp.]|uniref:TraB/GumN family protein n=1 Tax=Novosphingobium sp. TaxID=1874826 RepID=UPI0038B7A916
MHTSLESSALVRPAARRVAKLMVQLPSLMRDLLTTLVLVVALGACHKAAPAPPQPPARVALWEVSSEIGVQGWIMGTVHALPHGTQWRRPAIDNALRQADRLVLEIGEPLNPTIAGNALARLAYTDGLPPPSQRVGPKYRAALAKVYQSLSLTDAQFQNEESWAVALQIAAIGGLKSGMDPETGVEPQLRAAIGSKPVEGLETIDQQFGVFDQLPPRAQKVLLEQVAVEAADNRDDDRDLMALWLRGDDLGIAHESSTGFLADPALYGALVTQRNSAWANKIDAMLKAGAQPFVAVGAAHVAGTDGLPQLLKARGWKVRRID